MSSYTIPNVIAQHPRGERIMDVYSHLLTERVVYLGTAIDAGRRERPRSPSCCTWTPTTPTATSSSTSTARAATRARCSPSTTRCSYVRPGCRDHRASGRRSASARCCSRPGRREARGAAARARRAAPAGGAGAGRDPRPDPAGRRARAGARRSIEHDPRAPHRAGRGEAARRHRPRPRLHGRPRGTTASSTAC